MSLAVTTTAAVAREVPSPFEPAERDALLTVARSLPRLHSLLVLVCDEFVEEHYFHGWSPERPANLKSASKSILSILVGIAIDEGFLQGVYFGGNDMQLRPRDIPRLDTVVVMTSSPHPGDGRRAHLRALYDMVEHNIVPALLAGSVTHE